eukprot:TRINITY_DN5171_c0_g1_i1.p1 TRINITY_DN5171_c0_g1~~TRINITY_DN5171_c0_g1_i1.p1  ORF type:complete len:119 (+),score=22.91 TRINITY_DN5171_c0_g1_i1:25-381(+)
MQSYRLSTEITQRLMITESGNYSELLKEEQTVEEEKVEEEVEASKASVRMVMDRFGNFVPSSESSTSNQEKNPSPKVKKSCRFEVLEDTESSKIDRQVTRHANALYVYSGGRPRYGIF